MSTRASNSPLQPGEHSIERTKPTKTESGWALHWRIRLWDGRTIKRTSKATTKGEVRARARAKAEELLSAGGSAGQWKKSSKIDEYLETVTKPLIESERLAPKTRERYARTLKQIVGDCRADKHKRSLVGLSIGDAMKPRTLKSCVEEIAQIHGVKNAKHAKLILSKYCAKPMIVDGILEHDPTRDFDLDLTKARKPSVQRGGHALTRTEYQKVIQWLLAQDPSSVQPPIRGRWSVEDRVKEREELLLFVLTQASTGMRTSEIAQRPVNEVEIEGDAVVFSLPAEATKTRKARRVPVLNPEVAKRIIKRVSELPEDAYLFGSPTISTTQWTPRNRDRKLASLYRQIAEECGIELFKVERGHSWRATLNSLLADQLEEAQRIRLLGHTREVNRSHYTDLTEIDQLQKAASAALQSDLKGDLIRNDPQ